jgi:hypothetical protein
MTAPCANLICFVRPGDRMNRVQADNREAIVGLICDLPPLFYLSALRPYINDRHPIIPHTRFATAKASSLKAERFKWACVSMYE